MPLRFRPRGSLRRAAWLIAALAPLCHGVWAQDQTNRRLNVSASVDGDVSVIADRRAVQGDTTDTVTQLRPGFRIDSRSGRIVGSLSYGLSLSHHTRQYDGENVQNYLSASLQAEAIERWMYVDASASVTQQSASAYGQQSTDSSSNNANRIEVGSLTVSPYVRGAFGPAVTYEARLTGSATNGRRSIAADSSSHGGSLNLASAVPGTLIGWGLVATTQTVDFRAGRQTQSDRYSLRLSLTPDQDLSLNVRGGQEFNDVANVVKTRYANWGAGLTWRPSPRTRVQLDTDERYFGRSHQVFIEHRLPSSSVQFTSSREAANGADPSSGGQRITLYQFLDRVLATAFPDPAERDAQIRALLQNANNADPNQLISTGSINSAITLFERNQLSFTYSAGRISSSVQVFSSSTRILDAAASTAATAPDHQWGYLGTASYRLTPTALISVNGTRMITRGTEFRSGTELKSLTLGWSDQIARRTTAGVNLRYTVFNSSNPDAYRQAAISASLSQRF
jgi:uncharacterized protein (PEP-CTERM system associated)